MANYLPATMTGNAGHQQATQVCGNLQQQSTEPLQGSMVSGHYIAPSVTQDWPRCCKAIRRATRKGRNCETAGTGR